jgi:hypothetical protein
MGRTEKHFALPRIEPLFQHLALYMLHFLHLRNVFITIRVKALYLFIAPISDKCHHTRVGSLGEITADSWNHEQKNSVSYLSSILSAS